MTDYVSAYEEAVKNGQILAGKKIKQAIKRDQNDRSKIKDKKYPFYFDEDEAAKAVKIIQLLPTPEGQRLKLAKFQAWLISMLFGWRVKRDGSRRFSEAYISMARKNGKSMLMAAICSYCFVVEGMAQDGLQILWQANTLKQSLIGFNFFQRQIKKLARLSPSVSDHIKINRTEVLNTETGATAQAMANNLDALDGFFSNVAVIDEAASADGQNGDRLGKKILGTIRTGQVNSPNSLLAVISTAGSNLNSNFHQNYKYYSKVLNGKAKAERTLIAIWEQDDQKEVSKCLDDPKLFEKANPLLEVEAEKTKMLPKLLGNLRQAMAKSKGDLLQFEIKNCNLWLQAEENSFMQDYQWQAAKVDQRPDINGQDVYIGVDLSSTNDLTSVAFVYPIQDAKKPYWYVTQHSFIGAVHGIDQKIKEDNFDYKASEKRGECSITDLPSGLINYDDVYSYLINFVKKHDLNVKGVFFDPWNKGQLIGRLEKTTDWPLIEVRQGLKSIAPSLSFCQYGLLNGFIKHGEDQLFRFAINNVVIKYDKNFNGYPTKTEKHNRIDCVMAALDCFSYLKDKDLKQKPIKHSDEYFKHMFEW